MSFRRASLLGVIIAKGRMRYQRQIRMLSLYHCVLIVLGSVTNACVRDRPVFRRDNHVPSERVMTTVAIVERGAYHVNY